MRAYTIILATTLLLLQVALAAPHQDYPDSFSAAHNADIAGEMLSVSDDVVYKTAYHVASGGSFWIPFELDGNSYQGSDDWLASTASASLPSIGEEEHYVIIYTCTKGATWDCHGGKWQLLSIQESAQPIATSWDFETSDGGTLEGGARLSQDSERGSVLMPNGGVFRVPSSPALSPTQALSLSAWIRLDSTDTFGKILMKPTADGIDPWEAYALDVSTGEVRFILSDGSPYDAGGWHAVQHPLAIGAWHHVVGTYDGNTMRLYIDGSLVAQEDGAFTITATDEDLLIGDSFDSTSSLDGLLDDIDVFDYALSGQEISELYGEEPIDDPCADIQCPNEHHCENGACVPDNDDCDSHANYYCSGNAVYWFDSCDNIEELIEQCGADQTCEHNACVDGTPGDEPLDPPPDDEYPDFFAAETSICLDCGTGGSCSCTSDEYCSNGICLLTASSGTTRYVSTTGSDSNDGSISSPWRTWQHATSQVGPGDVLYIREGTYQGTIRISASGSESAVLTIAGYPGEEVVVDGAYEVLVSEWDHLFRLSGNHVVLRDFTVTRSYGMGLVITGSNNHVINVDSLRNMENGILVQGDHNVVEYCEVGHNCLSNEDYSRSRNWWASGLSAARHPSHVTLRNNVVHHNWGEGLSTYEAEYTLLEGNIVYNNQANVYLSDTKHSTLRGNLIFSTPGNPIAPHYAQTGILMGDEKFNPPSSDNTVINNLVIGNVNNFYSWQNGGSGGLDNVVIAHNTFVNALPHPSGDGYHGNVKIHGSDAESMFINNIIVQEDDLLIASISSASNTFANNLWSKNPPSTASGAGDVIADPLLQTTGPVTAESITAEWFELSAQSPAIDAGRVTAYVRDHFDKERDSSPDIGAIEYQG